MFNAALTMIVSKSHGWYPIERAGIHYGSRKHGVWPNGSEKQNVIYIAGVRVGVQKLCVHVETNFVVPGGWGSSWTLRVPLLRSAAGVTRTATPTNSVRSRTPKAPMPCHLTCRSHPSGTLLFRDSCHRLETSSFDI